MLIRTLFKLFTTELQMVFRLFLKYEFVAQLLLVILEIIKIPNTHEMKLTDDVSDASQMLVVSGRPAMTKIEAE